ncbi:MAG: YdeI/OmpD-associated family protein [Planctomycetes bacterium]|nr:YdeI/OmpD-associated family protein [Planctomycetota bacterium]
MSEILEFHDRAAFRAWLEQYGETSGGVWLLFGKKGGPVTLSAHEALEEALCFGWIDGQMQSLDATRYKKYFACRTAKSNWSDKNKKLAQSLLDRNLVATPGLDAINAAQKRGDWERSSPGAVPEAAVQDFINRLDGLEPARSNLLAMSPSVQRTYAGFYFDAKQEKTRQSRLEKITDRLNHNLKPM